MENRERLIVALDVDSADDARKVVEELRGYVRTFKIGSRLFAACGPAAVQIVKDAGKKVFLDLKLHDIPNTVLKTSEAIGRLRVDMYDVHCLGGREMLGAAVSARKGKKTPMVFGVTVLTHLTDRALERDLGVRKTVMEEVLHLVGVAMETGLDGVICSPREIAAVRKVCGNKLIITPGIRPEWAPVSDQRRAMTPKQAVEEGADYIVVGRPVLDAENKSEAVEKILDEIS